MATAIDILFKVIYYYQFVLIARVLMSWVPDIERTKVGEILYKLTEWYLGLFRRFIPSLPLGGGYLDFSPIVALLAWQFVDDGVLIVLRWVL